MDHFTGREAFADLLSPASKSRIFTKRLRLDSKGRLLLPVEVRRSFGLFGDSEVELSFCLDSDIIILTSIAGADMRIRRGEQNG